MDLDPSVVWDFAGTLVGTLRERPRQLPATVARVDPDGTVWLSMPGADGLVPASTTADVRADDAVTVEWWGNAYHVTGNGTSPSIGTRAARAMRRATAAAAKVAGEAKGIADAVGQHFWADGNGVHVSNEDGNATGERNILMNSLGILLRQGSAWLASFSDSAVAFYDGLGNEAANIVAQFGSDGATIGRSGESHMEMDYHSLRMVDREGGTYFWASDLRDEEGYLTETFDGDGVTRIFMVALTVKNHDSLNPYASVWVDGIDTSYTMNGPRELVLANAPVSGAEIVVRYMPTTGDAKAYTLGRRADGKVGPYSVAEGVNTIASGNRTHAEGVGATAKGDVSHAEGYHTCAMSPYSHAEGFITTAGGLYSHAQNYQTTAASDAQTAIGKYNDNDPDNAFEVGNGSADDARSNALAVGWDGTVTTARDILVTSTSDMSGIMTAGSQITVDIFKFCQRGNVASILLRAKKSTATAANTAITVGTIAADRRPPFECAGPGTLGVGDCWVDETGVVKFRSTSQIAANANFYVRVTYPVA